MPQHFPAVAIFDVFKGQTTPSIFQLLEENHIYVVSIPANCTNCLQPMDLSVNKCIKDFLKKEFTTWYSEKVYAEHFEEQTPVDLRLSVMKPIGAQWLINAFDYLVSHNDIIVNGFKASGIVDIPK